MTEAETIYRDFCEAGELDNPFGWAWSDFERAFGEIQNGSLEEKLVIAAMQYAIENRTED